MPDDEQIVLKEIYQQQYAHFGRMNDTLYKMPPIFSAIIGGLWYFAAGQIKVDRVIAAAVFVFAGVSCICFVIALQRFRLAFSAYLDNLNKMDGAMKVTIRGSRLPSTLAVMTWLVSVAGLMSFAGAFYAAFAR
jgi:hypothetical protein